MARVRSTIKISGKVRDDVFVQSKHGDHIRKAPKKSTKKAKEAALAQQYKRTGFLNSLAAELNRIIGAYSGILKPSGFYQALQKRFRKEPLNNRFLLLKQLENMEVHPTYPLDKLGQADVTVRVMEKKIMVRLQVSLRPSEYVGRYKANCYAYEVAIICWSQGPGSATYDRQFGEWIYIEDGLPEFEFLFKRPAGIVHWLICVKQQLGKNEQAIESFIAEGMQIVTVGTLDKKDIALLTQRKEEEKAQAVKEAAKNNPAPVKRVKAKSVK